VKPPTDTIRRAIRADATTVTHVIATALSGFDVCRWLVPDDGDRASVLVGYVRIVVDHAIAHGTVETVTDRSAVAVWLPSSAADIPGRDAKVAAVCGPWTPRFQALETAMRQAYPSDRGDHEYLALLAVLPKRQHEGLASALLANRHAVLDHAGRPACLVAGTARSRELYARHGYVDSGPVLDLPYEGEPAVPMSRQAPFTPSETEREDR
jgi:GNAT superfamily N-acetyltransferase